METHRNLVPQTVLCTLQTTLEENQEFFKKLGISKYTIEDESSLLLSKISPNKRNITAIRIVFLKETFTYTVTTHAKNQLSIARDVYAMVKREDVAKVIKVGLCRHV